MAVDGITATYIAANQFSVTGNQTADFHAGRRVKAELTGGDVYSTISGSVFGAVTTVTLYDSELDNTLTKVWYGIGWGSAGSLPDHTHDGSEGSGGSLTISGSGVTNHSELNELDYASSGHTGFASSASLGNYLAKDGTTQLTGDWDFGSQTISGTGDIWCQDLHTAGGSLYIGDVQLTSAANVLNFGSNTISGTGDIAGGRLHIGDTVDLVRYASKFVVIVEDPAVGWGAMYKYSDNAAGSAPGYYKARGSYTVPAAVQASDIVGGYNAFAYDGSSFDNIGKIRHLIESIGSGNVKSYIEFYVSDSSGVEQEMARLNSTGLIVGDAVTQQADYAFHVLDSWAIISLDGSGSTSDAGLRLEKQGVSYWHFFNDADQSDRLVLNAEGSSFHSLVISNTYGTIGIGFSGTNQPTSTTKIVVRAENTAVLDFYQYADTAGGCAFGGFKARGPNQNSPAAVQADDVTTGWNAYGYDGSSWDTIGRCRHLVESISAGNIAGYLEIQTSDTAGICRQVTRIDSEGRYWISAEDIVTNLSNWQTIVNTNNILNILDVQDNRRSISMLALNDGAGGPAFNCYKGRGNSVTSPTAVQAVDTLAGDNIYAYDGTTWDFVGEIKMQVEAIAAGNIASYYRIDLSDTSGSKREVFRIHSTGRLELYESGITVDGDIYTTASGAYDIGTLASPFRDIYLTGGSVYLNAEKISSPSPGIIDFNNAEIINATISGGGVTDHSALNELDYASAGHTNFVSTNTTQTITGAKTFSQDVTINADLTAQNITATSSGTFGYVEITDSISEILFTAASGIIGVAGDEDLLLLTANQLTIQGQNASQIIFSTASGTIGMSNHIDLLTLTSGIVYIDGDLDVYRHVAIGSGASIDFPGYPTYESLLNIDETFDASIIGAYGINLYARGAADSGSASVRGVSANALHTSSGQFSLLRGVYGAAYNNVAGATGSTMYGVYGSAYIGANNTTVTNIIGGYFTAGSVYSMSTASGTNVAAGQFKALSTGSGDFSAVNVYGVQIIKPGASYNGTLTNLYGLYIEDMTASSMTFTNEYNIYSAGATSKNYFEGDIYCNDIFTASGTVWVGNVEISNPSPGVLDFGGADLTGVSGTVGAFLELTDTPSSYTGHAGKSAVVKGDETGLEFVTVSGSGSSQWSDHGNGIYYDGGNVGVGGTPLSDIPLVVSGTNTQIRFGETDDSGGYLISTDADQALMAAGAYYNGANWIAKAAGAKLLSLETSSINFTINTGLTPGNSFSPTSVMRVDTNGTLYLNDSANANMTIGLTINQGANDDEALALKSSDVAHGITDYAETDTYALMMKSIGDTGGLKIRGFTEATVGFEMQSFFTSDNTTKSISANAPFAFTAYKKSGTGYGDVGAGGNVFCIRAAKNASVETVWIGDEDGATWQTSDVTIDGSGARSVYVKSSDSSAFYRSYGNVTVGVDAAGGLRVYNNNDSVAFVDALRDGADDQFSWVFSTQPTGGVTTERMRITYGGQVTINDTDQNANMTIGLTINQGANDDEILAFKSSDVSHTYAGTESDTFATFTKCNADEGGMFISALRDNNVNGKFVLALVGRLEGDADTTKSISGRGIIEAIAGQTSGGGEQDIVSNGNAFAVRARSGSQFSTRFIVGEDGNVNVNGTSITVSTSAAAGPELILDGSYTNGYARIQMNNDAQGWYIVNDGNDWFKVYNNNVSKSVLKIAPGAGLENNLTIDNGLVLIGDSANAKMTIGLTINQGANDDEIFTLKSSDVGHPVTSLTETDTYFYIKKQSATQGGVSLYGITDDDIQPFILHGVFGTTDPFDPRGAVEVRGYKSDGGTGTTTLADTETIFNIRNNTLIKAAFYGDGSAYISKDLNVIGDITCNDIYTASGTVYIGSEQISSPSPGVLDFGGATIQNTTIPGTFGGGVVVFVRTIELTSTSGTLDFDDIPQTADNLVIVGSVRNDDAGTGNNAIAIRFNNDSTANYDSAYGGDSASGGLSSGVDGSNLSYMRGPSMPDANAPANKFSAFQMFIPEYKKTDRHKSQFAIGYTDVGTGTADFLSQHSGGTWQSTSAITSIQLYGYNGGDFVAGSKITLYGISTSAQTSPLDYDKGRQELFIEYATTSGINILPGRIDIEDGSDEYALQVSGTLFKESNSLSASTWYYVYAKPPVSGNVLSESEIELSTTAPTRNTTKRGYYHGSNTTWRCFGAFYSKSDSTVKEFYQNSDQLIFNAQLIAANDITPSDSWTEVTLDVPGFVRLAELTSKMESYNSDERFYIREAGSNEFGREVSYYHTNGRVARNTFSAICSTAQKIEVKFETSTSNAIDIAVDGFYLPDWVAPK